MSDPTTQPEPADDERSPLTDSERLQQARDAQRKQAAERAQRDAQHDHPDAHMREPRSGPGEAVDHDRAPGVPPQTVDDYEDLVDKEGAESFPASDPPSGW